MIIRIGASVARTRDFSNQGIYSFYLSYIQLVLLIGALAISQNIHADPLGFADNSQDLPSLGSQGKLPSFNEEEVGEGLYKALEKPHRIAEAVGGYGLRAMLEETGISYEQYRKLVKKVTRYQLTADSEFYAEPNSLNVESRYLNGEVVTRFSTKSNGDIRFSLDIPF